MARTAIPEKPALPRYPARDFFREGVPFFIERVTHLRKDFSRWDFRRREFWKIAYVLEGWGAHTMDGRRLSLRPGCVYLVHPEDETGYLVETELIRIIHLLFLPSMVFPELSAFGDASPFPRLFARSGGRRAEASAWEVLYVVDRRPRKILPQILAMEEEFEARAVNYRAMLRQQLLGLLILLGRAAATEVQRVDPGHLADFLRDYIERHYAEDLTLDLLAKAAGYQPAYTSSRFHQQAGVALFDHLHEVRIREAKKLLRETPRSVLEIAHDVGFRDSSFFHRTFRRLVGTTPLEWRGKSAPTGGGSGAQMKTTPSGRSLVSRRGSGERKNRPPSRPP